MKKNASMIIVAGLLGLLLFSCNPNGAGVTGGDAAKDLTGLRTLLPGIEASVELLKDSGSDVKVLARTVDSGSDDSLTGKTPSQVYNEYGGTGTVRVPSTGYFKDFDGNQGVEAYFTMKPDGDYYRIKLYTYPSTDFGVKYNYEEYLVGSGSGSTTDDWTYMDGSHTPNRYITYKTYFSDGSVADRQVTFTSGDSNPDQFYNSTDMENAVKDDILGSGNYNYPSPIPGLNPSSGNSGTWSSKTESTVELSGGSTMSAVEYYTEDGNDYSGVTYISTDSVRLWSTNANTVERYLGNYHNGTAKERSLTTIGNIGSTWFTQTNAVDKSLNNSRIHYEKVQKIWYTSPDKASASNISYQQNLVLNETGVNTNQFSGTVEDFWGSGKTGNKFNIKLTRRSDGSYNFVRSGWSAAFRSARSVQSEDLELTLTKSRETGAIFVNIPVGGGTFYGVYEQGSFVGVYSTASGQQFSASITMSGISINGTVYKYSEL